MQVIEWQSQINLGEIKYEKLMQLLNQINGHMMCLFKLIMKK